MPDVLVAVVIGIIGGLIAGMFGVGGGAVFVPAMVLVLDRPQHEAQGVSLAAIIVTAAAATMVHRRHGHIDKEAVVWVTPVAMLFGFIGGAFANQLPAETLRRIFAVVLMALGARMLLVAWRAAGEITPPEAIP